MFASLFSGNWDGDRDDQGRVFLNYDPELVKLIVQHLQFKRIEEPFNPFPPPTAPAGKEMKFEKLLDFFGLNDFFNPIVPFLRNHSIAYIGHNGKPMVSVANVGKSTFTYADELGVIAPNCSILGSRLKEYTTGTFWKVTIDALRPDQDLFLGTLKYEKDSGEAFAIGWGGRDQFHVDIAIPSSGFDCSFNKGECLYFRLHDTTLSMFSVDKHRTWTMNHPSLRPRKLLLFFAGHEDVKLTLSCMDAKERMFFMSNLEES